MKKLIVLFTVFCSFNLYAGAGYSCVCLSSGSYVSSCGENSTSAFAAMTDCNRGGEGALQCFQGGGTDFYCRSDDANHTSSTNFGTSNGSWQNTVNYHNEHGVHSTGTMSINSGSEGPGGFDDGN